MADAARGRLLVAPRAEDDHRRRGACRATSPTGCSRAADDCGTSTDRRRPPSIRPAARCTPASADITIGKPLANTQLYVLDDRDGLVPAGAVGNLFIGGDGLAKGYFDRSDLTAQSFRTISLAGRAPQRLYRTGDLARLLPSGDFELRGRVDHQVKLRGFRIELEEIESVLRQAPGVRDCAVLLRNDAGPDPALVAYVVAADGAKPAEFAAHLASRLPDYMVPARWVELEALPLTPSGKVDRNALPPPAPAATETATPATALPRTPLEARIAAVWASVIGRQEVGIHDPLFALGRRFAAGLPHRRPT